MNDESTYQIGVAYWDITPTQAEFDSEQLYLWGFASRTEPVRGTRTAEDRLRVTALSISASNGTVVLIALDVGALSEEMTEQIRSALQTNHGIPPEHVCINVSHTHAAPTVVSLATWPAGVNTANAAYLARVIAATIGCVANSLAAQRPAQLYAGRGEARIGGPRGNGKAGYDPTLDVIVAKADGAILATVFSTACHPVLVTDNVVSADYPGVARALLEAKHGGVGMFLQGFAGQTNPEDIGVEAIGQHLFAAVDDLLGGALAQISGPLMGRHAREQLPLEALPVDWKSMTANNSLLETWAGEIDSQIASGTDGTLPTEVQTLRVGVGPSQLRVLASSHEATCDLGMALRELLPVDRVTTLAYCNHQCCYIGSKAVLQTGDVRPAWPSGPIETNYEGGQSFIYYVRRAPLTDAAVDQYLDAFRRIVNDPWTQVGHATSVTAMAAAGETLYVTTSNDILWSRPAAGGDMPWTNIGDAQGICGLALLGDDLFAATTTGRLVTRPAAGGDQPWIDIGHAEDVAAMTAHQGMLYAATHGNTLWVREPLWQDTPWTSAGPAELIAGLASAGGLLIAATSIDGLWWRSSPTGWSRLGTAQHVVGMSAIGNTLYVATREGGLWTRVI